MSEDRIILRFDSFRSFLDECSGSVSEEGIFLATDAVRPVGSSVEFDLGLDSEFPLLRGSGEVLWVVEPNGEGATPGMALRYESTDDATAKLVRKIAERQRAQAGSVFELVRSDGPSFATQAVEALITDELEPAAEEGVEEAAGVESVSAEPEVEAEAPAEGEAVEEEEAAAEAEPESTEEVLEAPAAAAMPPYLEGAVGAKKSGGKRAGLWSAIALIAVLLGVGYWQRDFLAEKLGGGSAPAETRGAEPVEAPVSEPEASEPVEQEPVEPTEVEAADPIPAPVTGPLTRIEEVRWIATDEGTLLQLLADGAFEGDLPGIERLEDPPRLVVKIPGVTTPLARPTLAIGSEEVVGVRTALHGSPPSSSLHVVVDLADPTAQVTATEAEGALLQLRIASAAISP